MARQALLLCALAYGCSGEIDTGPLAAGLTTQQQIALNDWLNLALPAFQASTCVTCHEGNAPVADGSAEPYLEGSDQIAQRDQLIGFSPPVINLLSPRASTVLVKGMHEGPPLDEGSANNILTWIQAEAVARLGSAGADLPITAPYTLIDCTAGSACDAIDLTTAGAPPGSTITFEETPYADDGNGNPEIQLQQIAITAGAQGLHVVHPNFGTVVTTTTSAGSGSGSAIVTTSDTFDPEDRYYALDMEIDPMGTLSLSSTTIDSFFDGFDHANPMVIQFDTLSAEGSDTGSDPGSDTGSGSGSGSGSG